MAADYIVSTCGLCGYETWDWPRASDDAHDSCCCGWAGSECGDANGHDGECIMHLDRGRTLTATL